MGKCRKVGETQNKTHNRNTNSLSNHRHLKICFLKILFQKKITFLAEGKIVGPPNLPTLTSQDMNFMRLQTLCTAQNYNFVSDNLTVSDSLSRGRHPIEMLNRNRDLVTFSRECLDCCFLSIVSSGESQLQTP